ncbi:transmembrane protein 141-like [Acanthaster planci]|uniref:Transmembrane protein 141-like n=1 Tax=Acanthaster planci TaxID=133434 RepID=A0A8B7ZJ21_ACAPL|nr:transmembrane protein 141-like [Acanthaster planci]
MVLVGISDLDEETAGKYPGIYQYGQCQSRAFIKGIFAFFAGGVAGLTASHVIKRRYPTIPAVYNVVFVAGGAIITSYAVASIASKQCQRMWVHTAQHNVPADAKPGSVYVQTTVPTPEPESVQCNGEDIGSFLKLYSWWKTRK